MAKAISSTNVRVWFDNFITAKEAAGLSPKTLRWYKERLFAYLTWIDAHNGRRPFDAMALEAFLAERARTQSKATVQSYYRVISTLCSWLIKRRLIAPQESPMVLVQKPRLPQKRMKFVTQAEYETLNASIRGLQWCDHRDRLLFAILFYSGLRARELTHLRIGDIELAAGVIIVRDGKGAKDRVVPFAPHVPALLEAYLGSRPAWAVNDALFVSNDGEGGIRGQLFYDGLKEVMRRRCRAAGLPRLGLHSFRHGFAMWALNSGVPMSALSAMLGHTSVVTTESIYAQWVTSAIRREYTMAFDRLANDGLQA